MTNITLLRMIKRIFGHHIERVEAIFDSIAHDIHEEEKNKIEFSQLERESKILSTLLQSTEKIYKLGELSKLYDAANDNIEDESAAKAHLEENKEKLQALLEKLKRHTANDKNVPKRKTNTKKSNTGT